MIFEKKSINTGRQPELDLARGFAALLVILCHVGLYIGNESNRAVFVFSDIIGSEPCAPVFMALMGACCVYSRHQNPKYMFCRGIRLLFGGYLLSVFRTLLPRLIFGNIDGWTNIDSFFVIDILQLAGLTFMLLALLKKMKVPSWGVLLLSLVMVAAGQFFIANPPVIENNCLTYIVNLFIPVTKWSCFPFLTWSFFPAFGLVFGEILLRCREKKIFYGVLLPVSLIGVVYVYSQFARFYPAYAENYYFGGNYYYMGIKNVLLTAFFITFFISLWYFVDGILPGFVKRFLNFLSRNLTAFYVFSWIFISAVLHISAAASVTYGSVMTVVFMVITAGASCAATWFYLVIKNKIEVKIALYGQKKTDR